MVKHAPHNLFHHESAPPRLAPLPGSHRDVTLGAVDLFSGCGGLSAGLVDAGFDVAEAYDCWPQALATYRRNLGSHAIEFDLSDTASVVKRISKVGVDLIAGAPPRQDFSTAGKRIEGVQANLTSAFGQIVCECQPAAFLMENVPQVRTSITYQMMRSEVTAAGYSLVEMVLDASRFGVPQLRRRFFAFGFLGNGATGPNYAEGIKSRETPHRTTVKEFLGHEIDIEYYYRHPRNYSRRAVFSVHEPSPTVRGVNRPVPPKLCWQPSRQRSTERSAALDHARKKPDTDVPGRLGMERRRPQRRYRVADRQRGTCGTGVPCRGRYSRCHRPVIHRYTGSPKRTLVDLVTRYGARTNSTRRSLSRYASTCATPNNPP